MSSSQSFPNLFVPKAKLPGKDGVRPSLRRKYICAISAPRVRASKSLRAFNINTPKDGQNGLSVSSKDIRDEAGAVLHMTGAESRRTEIL